MASRNVAKALGSLVSSGVSLERFYNRLYRLSMQALMSIFTIFFTLLYSANVYNFPNVNIDSKPPESLLTAFNIYLCNGISLPLKSHAEFVKSKPMFF